MIAVLRFVVKPGELVDKVKGETARSAREQRCMYHMWSAQCQTQFRFA